MISDIVLSLAILGGISDHLAEMESGAVSASLRVNVMSTQDDVMEYFERNPAVVTKIFDLLDVNRDGMIDAQELAAMEMKGATTASLDLTPDEAFTLADGSVREDGDVGTSFVSELNFKEWIARGMWANLLRVVDANDDGTLDSSEWGSLVQASENMLADYMSATATLAADTSLVAPGNYVFPESNSKGTKALVAAGMLLGAMDKRNAEVATRRIFGLFSGAAGKYAAAAVGVMIVDSSLEAFKHASYKGCWVDDGNRDLDAKFVGRGHDVDSCFNACRGYNYFAVQHRDWCVCGHAYGTESKYYKVADSECNVYGKHLGGPWRNAVFARKL